MLARIALAPKRLIVPSSPSTVMSTITTIAQSHPKAMISTPSLSPESPYTVVVTGSSRGLGQQFVRTLCERKNVLVTVIHHSLFLYQT
jgi:hypothetical protein